MATRLKLVAAITGATPIEVDGNDSVGWTVCEVWDEDEDEEGIDLLGLTCGDGVRAGAVFGRPWGEVGKGEDGRFERGGVEATGGSGVSRRGKKLKRGFGRGWMGMLYGRRGGGGGGTQGSTGRGGGEGGLSGVGLGEEGGAVTEM